MLGRAERLEDLFITGGFDPDQIRCNPESLAETKRLELLFEEKEQEEREARARCWKISYLNVRSIQSSHGHRQDVACDNLLMSTDMFGLGETWLESDEQVNFEDFSGYFANFRNGKGIAGYTKIDLITRPEIVSSNTYSAMVFRTTYFHIIFLYLSKNYNKVELFEFLDNWIDMDFPTAVIGDINENLGLFKKAPFKQKMISKGFQQLIKEPTCTTGGLIDHIYANSAMKALGIDTEIDAAYYSDHDIVSLCIKKPE